ncbi:MAG: LysM peptidoglycan-binding domain-containing protein [Chitinophagaceae bacterium]
MKKLIIIVLLFCSMATFAQNEWVVQSNGGTLFLKHIVQPKEGIYSIGRLFNVPPKEIASLNKIEITTGLNVGQTILIPLSSSNFSQTTTTNTPVYYIVGEKEGLYRVSTNSGKVLMTSLRKWNNLTSDNLATGQKLIVGFLTAPEVAATAKTEPFKVKEVVAPPAVKEGPPQTLPTQKNIEKEKDTEVVTKAPVTPKNNSIPPATSVTYNDAAGGYFKKEFDTQSTGAIAKEQTATSGIFKTASGWQDGKYYALMDGVDPGTIVRVINPTNGKTIYAKVLGQMSGIRQNAGLELRISNAAASILDITDTDKFIVRVNR